MPSLTHAILDIDGVLLASPHERAWREALNGLCDPAKFTPELYQTEVAGKPRHDGAIAALIALGVSDAAGLAEDYAARKQARLEGLIAQGRIEVFPDAILFVEALKRRGVRMAAASSSKNATAMMQSVRLSSGGSLLDLFKADVSGRDVLRGKPSPDLFLLAASELQVPPGNCFVVEDSPAGVRAAKTGGMYALGVTRDDEVGLLDAAGADLVVTNLAEVDLSALLQGRVQRSAA